MRSGFDFSSALIDTQSPTLTCNTKISYGKCLYKFGVQMDKCAQQISDFYACIHISFYPTQGLYQVLLLFIIFIASCGNQIGTWLLTQYMSQRSHATGVEFVW